MSVKVVYKCQKVTRLINFSVIMNWKKVISEHIHYGDITKGTGPINILCLWSNAVEIILKSISLLLLKYNISFEVFLTVT